MSITFTILGNNTNHHLLIRYIHNELLCFKELLPMICLQDKISNERSELKPGCAYCQGRGLVLVELGNTGRFFKKPCPNCRQPPPILRL